LSFVIGYTKYIIGVSMCLLYGMKALSLNTHTRAAYKCFQAF